MNSHNVVDKSYDSSHQYTTHQLDEEKLRLFEHSLTAYSTMIAGGIAGCVSKTLMAPLSRVTILYQVSSAMPTHPAISSSVNLTKQKPLAFLNLIDALERIIKQEGFFSLWKGNFTSVLHRFPYSAINFAVYESSREYMKENLCMKENVGIRFISGALGGGIACVVCYPLDLIRTRLTIDASSVTHTSSSCVTTTALPKQKHGIISTYQSIVHTEGLRGLYRGVFISLGVCIPNLAVSFSAYGTIKDKLLHLETELFRNEEEDGLNILGSLTSGALSGITSSLLIFPADLIRRRMQVRGLLQTEKKYFNRLQNVTMNNVLVTNVSTTSSINQEIKANIASSEAHHASVKFIDEVLELWRKEGIRGFYRGITPELLKVTPAVGITFCVYEVVLRFLVPK